MKIQIVSIVDRGLANKERLHLNVLSEVNLNYYVVLSTIYVNPNSISTSPKQTYWFPSTLVKPGDQVILYSGFGTNNSVPAQGGTTNHFFYWGQNNTLWGNHGECAVLLELNTWNTSPLE
jgi:hypothetical protein